MKTPSISLACTTLVICGLFAGSSRALYAQKKGLPVPIVNDNKNNNPNPAPVPVVKVAPRKVVKTKAKPKAVTSVPKQVVSPVQKRVEQPKLPPGMRRMGPGAASSGMRNLAKLKLTPPMKRKGNGGDSAFPQIGAESLDQQANRIHDIAFGQAANDLKDLGDVAGFADLIGGKDGPMLDFGLGGEGDSSGFADADDLAGLGGGGSRKDGLPTDAPPSGWGFLGGIASGGGAPLPQTATSTTADDGTVTKTWTTSENGTETSHYSSRSTDGSSTTGHTTRDEQGSYRVTRSKDSGGTLRETRTSLNPDGTGGAESFRRDPDGAIWYQTGRVGRPSGVVPVVDWGTAYPPEDRQVPSWMRNIGGNPGDDGTTESQQALANWMWRQHNLGKTTPGGGITTTNRVNPGDPDYEGAGVGGYPSIGAKFAGNIAVNPDPNMMSGGNHMPSARAWRLMQQDLMNGATPGPKTAPED